jgi:hypothetical protein
MQVVACGSAGGDWIGTFVDVTQALAKDGLWKECEEVTASMGDAGVLPNNFSELFMIQALVNAGKLDAAEKRLNDTLGNAYDTQHFHSSMVSSMLTVMLGGFVKHHDDRAKVRAY